MKKLHTNSINEYLKLWGSKFYYRFYVKISSAFVRTAAVMKPRLILFLKKTFSENGGFFNVF